MILALVGLLALQNCAPDSIANANAFAAARRAAGAEELPDSTIEWLTARNSSGSQLLARIGWDAPNSGALVLVRCDGQTLTARSTGAIDSMRTVQLTADSTDALLVYYKSGYGTGWLQYSAAVVLLRPDTLVAVLDLVTSEVAADPAANGSTLDSASVSWRSPGQLVRTGKRFTLRCRVTGVCRHLTAVPLSETYRWNAVADRFTRSRSSH